MSTTEQQPITDPRPDFERATDIAAGVLARVGPEDLRRPTPCDAYDVGQLAGHLVSVQRKVAAVARGEDPLDIPLVAPGLEPDGFAPAWADATADQRAVWSDDGLLGRVLDLGWAHLPGAVALAIWVSEVTVHTWDLATALGIGVDWDQGLTERSLLGMRVGLPAEPRGDDVPFDPPVPVADDAPAIERLVAWVGRNPRSGT